MKLIGILIAFVIASTASVTLSASDPASHHLTADAARDIAIRALEQQGLRLSDYDPPTVQFEKKYKEWRVGFRGKSGRIADWVEVVVDDRTSRADFHWGK
jgi:hypothetical protein